jgi:hypothetical protein
MADGPAPEREADMDGGGPPPAPVDYEPPWREARRRVTLSWARGGPGTRVALAMAGVIAAGLLGAFLFGLWHVVVGGFVMGNWNAGGFGFALAGVTGVLLWIDASIARRLLPPTGRGRSAGPGTTGVAPEADAEPEVPR